MPKKGAQNTFLIPFIGDAHSALEVKVFLDFHENLKMCS